MSISHPRAGQFLASILGHHLLTMYKVFIVNSSWTELAIVFGVGEANFAENQIFFWWSLPGDVHFAAMV